MDIVEISVVRSEGRVRKAVEFIDSLPSEQIENYLRRLATNESMIYSSPQAKRLLERAGGINELLTKYVREIDAIKVKFSLDGELEDG